jgi:hypothetical protein
MRPPLTQSVRALAAAFVFAGPTVLAFRAGGYQTDTRLLAGIVAWALVLALALTGGAPLPRSRPAWLALLGLVLLTAWSALSIIWAPLGGPAVQQVQRLVLYVGALLLALGMLRSSRLLRAVEPALAAGAAIVIGYGLSGRLLPGIIDLSRSRSAGGRLEQPITYWNGEGALAAVGFVLCARLVGDRTRPRAIRAAGAAGAVLLGTGVYLSYSRGAIAVALLGLVVLVAAAPTRGQVRGALIALAGGAAGSIAAAALPGVAALEGTRADRIAEGAAMLTILALLCAVAATIALRLADRSDRPLPSSGRLVPVAAVLAVAVAAGLVAGGLGERASGADLAAGAEAGRLTTVSSNRYEYWRVGLDAFAREPLTGLGAGGFRTEWLRKRTIAEAVRDAHSIEVEMAAELGLVGLVAFALMIGGTVASARRALRRARGLAAGPCAASLAWLLHASIDWDWQLPGVTLPAITLAAALMVLGEDVR